MSREEMQERAVGTPVLLFWTCNQAENFAFRRMSKEEADFKLKMESAEYKFQKAVKAGAVQEGEEVRLTLAKAWGLSLPRPPLRASRGGPKPRSEKWTQGLHDLLDDIVAGKR